MSNTSGEERGSGWERAASSSKSLRPLPDLRLHEVPSPEKQKAGAGPTPAAEAFPPASAGAAWPLGARS